MSLISKDFRQNHQPSEHRTPLRLRWVLLATALAAIGGVIASTNTNSSANNEMLGIQEINSFGSDDLPAFDEELAKATTDVETSQLAIKGKTDKKEIKKEITELVSAKPVQEIREQLAKTSDDLTHKSLSPELSTTQVKQETTDAVADSDTAELSEYQWRDYKVKSGDSLARLFKRAGLKPQQLDQVMKAGKDTKKLKRIFPGDVIQIHSDDNGQLQALRYEINHKSYLMVERKSDKLVAKTYSHELDRFQTHASGVIESSLFLAAQKAGISQNVIMELANIFGWDIDFALDIRKGDNFTVLYDEVFRDGEKISDGNILAAEFINNGKSYRAVRYTNPQNNTSEYFTPNGKSMKKAFLRTPVNFTRISSKFTTARYHPVLHKFRSHKGVDYAAKRGTPIQAAGNGKVIFKGKKGGYGNVIILQHGTKYTTLYAHVRSYNKKLRIGSRVTQGQTIAYVGSSGLATGPHLHYEFRVNGTHRNPLTVRLPTSSPVPKRYMNDFDLMTSPTLAQLDSLTRNNQLALSDN